MVCWFEECRKESVALVGGKCSSLGELMQDAEAMQQKLEELGAAKP